MILHKFIDNDLGLVSYIIADEISQNAMVIDPSRDISQYIEFIDKKQLSLKYIFNSHPHADFICGHLELTSRYPKAKNLFHHNLDAGFDFLPLKEEDILDLGINIKLKFLETPGHTPYCISCIVNEEGIDKYIFTGDILFIGDMGRPDLLGDELEDSLLELSYDSAQKLYNLPEYMMVLPSHTQGSLCGKNIMAQSFSTIGIEKQTNQSFSLSSISKEAYIKNLKTQEIETPKFFKRIASVNIKGPQLLSKSNNLDHFQDIKIEEILREKDSYVIDIREPSIFKKTYRQGIINIYHKSNVSFISGSLLDENKKIYIISDSLINAKQFINKMRIVGFEKFAAIIDSNLLLESVPNAEILIDPIILNLDYNCQNPIGEKSNITSLDTISLDKNKNYKFICNKEYKSSSASSYLSYLGFTNVIV